MRKPWSGSRELSGVTRLLDGGSRFQNKAARTSEIKENGSCIALGKPCNVSVLFCFDLLLTNKNKKPKTPVGAVVLNKLMHMNADSSVWRIVVWDD